MTRILYSAIIAGILISSAIPAFARCRTTHPGACAYEPHQMVQEHRSVAVPPGPLGFPPGILVPEPAPGYPGIFYEPRWRTTIDGEEI